MDMNLNKLWEMVKDREVWRAAVHRVTKSQIRQQLNNICIYTYIYIRFFFIIGYYKLLNVCCALQCKWKSLSHPIHCYPMDYTVHGILPGQNTGVGSLFHLQGIFATQESNPGLSHFRRILYQLSHKGSPTVGPCCLSSQAHFKGSLIHSSLRANLHGLTPFILFFLVFPFSFGSTSTSQSYRVIVC